MPLTAVNFVNRGPLLHVDLLQFYNLLTGVMTDQPVTIANSVAISGYEQLAEVAAPATPSAGQLLLYPKADHKLYIKDSTGLETQLGAGGGITLPLTQNLTFSPDSTYDIGAAGATRPRNLYLAGTASLGTLVQGAFDLSPVAATTLFQHATSNTASYLDVVPNGTATASGIDVFNTSSGLNGASVGTLRIDATSVSVQSTRTGLGPMLPLRLYTVGSSTSIEFWPNSLSRWRFDAATGHLFATTDNAVDIGAIGASRPRNVYAAGNGTFGGTLSVTAASTLGPAQLSGNLTFSPDNTYDIGAVAATRPRNVYAAGAFIGNGSVPAGGATGQVLQKNSATNYDLIWATPAGGVPTYPLRGPADTAAAPDFSFTASTSTGLYSPAVNSVGLSASGTAVLSATSALVTLPIAVQMSSTLGVNGTSFLQGNVGVGGASGTQAALWITSTVVGGSYSAGLLSTPTFGAGTTFACRAITARVLTAAGSYTIPNAYGLYVDAPGLGASSVLTSSYGLYVVNQGASSITNVYGLYIEAPTGATTTNLGLYNGGTSQLNGSVGIATAPTGDPLNVGGASQHHGAFGIGNNRDTRAAFTIDAACGGYMSGTEAWVVKIDATSNSGATGDTIALRFFVQTATAAYTANNLIGVRVLPPQKNAPAHVNSTYGLLVDPASVGEVNNYGVWIGAMSGGSGANIGLYNSGTSQLVGSIYGNFGAAVGSRTTFQSYVANNITMLSAVPNGTSRVAGLEAYNNVDPANSAVLRMSVDSGAAYLDSDRIGSVVNSLPLNLQVGGTTSIAIDSVGNVDVWARTQMHGNLLFAADNTYDIGASGATRPRNVYVGSTLYIQSSALVGAAQSGITCSPTFTSAAVTSGYCTILGHNTAAASFTMANGIGLLVVPPVVGASSSITTMRGVRVNNQGAAGITNAYGIWIDAPSGAVTTNIGLYNLGTTYLLDVIGIGIVPNSIVTTYVKAAPSHTYAVMIDGATSDNTTYAFIARNLAGGQIISARNDGAAFLATAGGALGFFGGSGQVKGTVTGSKGANAALTSLLTALANYGLITDSSS